MRRVIYTSIAPALLLIGCTSPKMTDFSPYYPATSSLRQDAVAHSVPTNAPFGSLYEVGIYIVQPTDTLDRVLERFHVTAEELASRNNCEPDSPHLRRLLVRQRLVIYERISQ
jgi:LysM repeat protein